MHLTPEVALLWVLMYYTYSGFMIPQPERPWGGCVSCIGSAEISRVSLDADLGSLWGIAFGGGAEGDKTSRMLGLSNRPY